jgi:hypothetical protein
MSVAATPAAELPAEVWQFLPDTAPGAGHFNEQHAITSRSDLFGEPDALLRAISEVTYQHLRLL